MELRSNPSKRDVSKVLNKTAAERACMHGISIAVPLSPTRAAPTQLQNPRPHYQQHEDPFAGICNLQRLCSTPIRP